ncbi:MAG: hypothetical protein ABFD29_11000 [Anaerolineaceae bacterium]
MLASDENAFRLPYFDSPLFLPACSMVVWRYSSAGIIAIVPFMAGALDQNFII